MNLMESDHPNIHFTFPTLIDRSPHFLELLDIIIMEWGLKMIKISNKEIIDYRGLPNSITRLPDKE